MRICHVITRFIRGGADENTLLSCNSQAQLNHEVHLIYGGEYDQNMLNQLDNRVVCHRVQTLQRNISPLKDIKALISTILLLKKICPEIVHTHTSKAGIIGRLAARMTGVNIIIHGIHILPFVNINLLSSMFYRWMELSVANITDAFISVSDEIRQTCIDVGIGTSERHFVVNSGMDLNKFRNVAEIDHDWKAVLGGLSIRPENPRFLVLVSRLERRKGQLDFLSVFADLAVKFPDIVLLIIGEGPDRPLLEGEISKRGLEGRAILTGFRPDVERLLAIADIGLLTSVREGLARVLIQYALVGLPIVATDIPGVRDIVIPNVTGYLAPPDDLAKMGFYLESLLQDEELRSKMSNENSRIDFTSWSVENMITKIDTIYNDIAQKKSGKRGRVV